MSYAGLPQGFTVQGAQAPVGLPAGFQVVQDNNVPAPEGAAPADYSKAQDVSHETPPATLGREFGLAGRSLLQNAAALPATIADIPVAAYNTGANLIQGKGNGFRFPEQNQAIANALSKVGFPQPATGLEHVMSGLEGGVGGAATGLGLGSALASMSNPVASGVGEAMTAMPGKAVTSGAMAGGASAGAAQAGLPWYAQMGAGLAAGAVPFMGPSGLASGGELSANEQQAMDAGYKLNPATMENPSLLSKLLGGWSGKVKTQQAASAANQETTNSLAAEELGLPHDTTLDDNVFSGVRSTAGKAYQAVRDYIPRISPDQDFQADVKSLGALNGELAKDFPELVRNDDISTLAENLANKESFSTSAGLDAVKTLRANGAKNLQAIGDPQKNALGFAQRQAADAIDDLIDRSLERGVMTETGPSPDMSALVDSYRAARQTVAKSYDIEAATNPATGDVSAAKIAQIGNRRPLTGGLQKIADMANAFPKAVQSPSKFGGVEPLSVLDIMGAGGTGAAAALAGRPLEGAGMAAAILSRPAARALIMSKAYQSALANPGSSTNTAATLAPAQLAPLISALQNYKGQHP